MNGNTYSITTYSFVNNSWKVTIGTILIPTGGNELSDEDLQQRIFKQKDAVYIYTIDVNDEDLKLVKKKANTEVRKR
jgi:hypothetical protein